jgi:hypothetical protein
MIEEQVKVHDKFSLEIKLGFLAGNQNINEFSVNTWVFIPNSLDINRWNYSKQDFYRDLKSNIRLITPVYTLQEIAEKQNEPYTFLEQSMQRLSVRPGKETIGTYEYHIRMYVSIIKSALREEIDFIVKNGSAKTQSNKEPAKAQIPALIENYISNIEQITANYRGLRALADTPATRDNLLNYYLFGDEFLSNLIEQHTFKLIDRLGRNRQITPETAALLMRLIDREIEYKKENNYPYVKKNSQQRNRELVFRLSLLKKYAENELFLDVVKRREGVLIEHIYFSIAAGISMIFATAIAFSIQRQYGNLTMPFFVALVVSYMLKDRIKDLARHYLAHRLGRRFFDTKTDISLSNRNIGWHKEGMDFITERKVPAEVLSLRQRSAILEAENRNNQEQIILYRMLVRLRRDHLNKVSPYPVAGMNDIIRFNISNYVNKMDNPLVPLYVPGENNTTNVIKGEKIYYINLIMQFKHSEGKRLKRYRIILNRKGIKEVETF